MLITMNFEKKRETKGCNIFESRTGDDFITLYLKKTQLEEAGIDPAKGQRSPLRKRS